MSSNLIKTTPPSLSPVVPIEGAHASVRPRVAMSKWRIVKSIASLRLTVFLFVLSIILVFFGTLAQINNGIWSVVGEYFRSFWVWIPFQLAVQFAQIFFGVDRELTVTGTFPFPGGWLIGTVLLANLLAAHLVRFKLSWKRSGILMIHAGLILMMAGELITGLWAVEGNMIIFKGQSANYLVHGRFSELAFLDRSDPEFDRVVVIPGALLRQGTTISDARLPVDVRVVKFMTNSGFPEQGPEHFENPATGGAGLKQVALERPEVSGADTEQKYDSASAYVTFLEKDTDHELGTYLVSILLTGDLGDQGLQSLKVGDKTFDFGLRYKRSYKPYEIQLLNFQHKTLKQTGMASDYRSTVRLKDSANAEDRKVEIYMNHPLRYRGETFFQSGVLPADAGTILQVVRNPGWLLPYFSCFIVTLGMIVHFGMSLQKFQVQLGGPAAQSRFRRV